MIIALSESNAELVRDHSYMIGMDYPILFSEKYKNRPKGERKVCGVKVCPKCRKKIDSDVKFCTNCGYPFDENEDDKKGNKKDKILYIVLAAVLVLLVATTALILNSKYHFLQVKGSEDAANDTEMAETVQTEEEPKLTQTATPTASVSAKPTQTATPTAKPSSTPTPTPSESSTTTAKTSPTPSAKATPTPTAKATPTPSKAPTAEINKLIKNYLKAFEEDLNEGEYRTLYDVVEKDSSMEKIQKDFIEESRLENQYEELLEYQIESIDKKDASTYHVTTLETIEVWQDVEPTHQKIKQRCVYIVSKQSDGSWLMSGFAKNVEFVEETTL